MANAPEGPLSEAQVDALLADPTKLNDPAAVASLAERGIVEGPAPGKVPEAEDDGTEGEESSGAEEGVEAEGAEAAGDGSDTAGAEPPAPADEDPAIKVARLEAETGAYRKMFEALPGLIGKKEEPVVVPPAPKPSHVVEWEQLAAVPKQNAYAHYERLVADGHTTDAALFLAAWQNAPGQLTLYREQESARVQGVTERRNEASAKAGAELKALSKVHPDWEKYADVMEDLAKRDAAAQQAGLPSAYSTMEELYAEARRKKGGAAPAALSPEDAKRKAALGRGPSSKRGGTSPAGTGGKPDPDQELIRSLLRNEVRI